MLGEAAGSAQTPPERYNWSPLLTLPNSWNLLWYTVYTHSIQWMIDSAGVSDSMKGLGLILALSYIKYSLTFFPDY